MGIPRYFQKILRRYPECIHTYRHDELDRIRDMRVNHLAIDLNATIHPCAQRVMGYGDNKPRGTLPATPGAWPVLPPDDDPDYVSGPARAAPTYADVYAEVDRAIDELVQIVRPLDTLILCMDGVAGYAKQSQQRQRRFRARQDAKVEDSGGFDSNVISPGTPFMYELGTYLRGRAGRRVNQSDPAWSSLTVVYSDASVPGEGEHKIVKWMRSVRGTYTSTDKTVIHGPDADMFMLSICTHMPNIFLLRRDHWNKQVHYMVDIDVLKSGILEDIDMMVGSTDDPDAVLIHISDPTDRDAALTDYVLMAFMVGNDFLPKMPALEIAENGLEVLVDAYRRALPAHGRLTRVRGGQVSIRWSALRELIRHVSDEEDTLIHARLNDTRVRRSDDSVLSKLAYTSGTRLEVDVHKYRDTLCAELNGISGCADRHEWCTAYLGGIEWVLRYYTEGIPSWDWYFPYTSAPMALDIVEYVKADYWVKRDKYPRTTYARTRPATPLEQLLSILPPQSAHILPVGLRYLMFNATTSPILDLYPTKFVIDREHAIAEWEGVARIPPVEPYRVRQTIDSIDLGTVVGKEDARRLTRRSGVSWIIRRGTRPERVNYI